MSGYRRSALAAMVGLTAVVGLVAWHGHTTLLTALATGGTALLWLPLWFLLVIVLAAMAWQWLLPKDHALGLGSACYLSTIGFGVNWLLPVAMVGGEAVRAHLLVRRGNAGDEAVASVVADKTIQVATQAAFAILGLALLVAVGAGTQLLTGLAVGTAALVVVLLAFYMAQRHGGLQAAMRAGSRLLGADRGHRLRVSGDAVEAALQRTYDRRGRLLAAFVLRLAARLVWAGEVMIALALLGHPVGVAAALIIESLTQAARAAGFMIPGGLGAQEGGLLLVGVALGIPAEICLALAVIKRGRELAIGLPGLLLWQLDEARHLRRPSSDAPGGGG